MLDIDKIPTSVLKDIRDRGFTDEQIAQMTPLEAFEEYCNWNGLINWAGVLWRTMHQLKKADQKKS